MMVEAMAGKSACLHGVCHDATPFTFSEEQPAVNHFAELLAKGQKMTFVVCFFIERTYVRVILCLAGYNYYGNERVYSGVNGQELEADIFVGNIYYQRLRHMVSDKYQVCSRVCQGMCQAGCVKSVSKGVSSVSRVCQGVCQQGCVECFKGCVKGCVSIPKSTMEFLVLC